MAVISERGNQDMAQAGMRQIAPPRLLRVAEWAACACLAAPYLLRVAAAPFARWAADDFALTARVLQLGFWGAQWDWYTQWDGRFTFSFLSALFAVIGPASTPIYVTAALLTWPLGLAWLLSELARRAGGTPRPAPLLLASGAFLFGVLQLAPNLGQSVYWQSGSLTYFLPMAAVSFGMAFALSRLRRGRSFRSVGFGCAVLAFFLGGFSETWAVMQITALGCAAATCALLGHTRWSRSFLIALAGAGAALVVVVLAPGNTIRAAHFPYHPGLIRTLLMANEDAWRLIVDSILSVAVLKPLLLVFFCALWAGAASGAVRLAARPVLFPLLLIVSAYLTLWSSYAPAVYGMGGLPPPRTLINMEAVVVGTVLLLGLWAGAVLREYSPARQPQNARRALTVLACVVGAYCVCRVLLPSLPTAATEAVFMRQYARAWGMERETLRDAHARHLPVAVVSDPSPFGVDKMSKSGEGWVNAGVARCYGVPRVLAR